jgi:hypothetical protein
MVSSGRPPDRDDVLEAMARRFDEVMGRARGRAAAIDRAADELAGLQDVEERRRLLLGDLAVDLDG